MSYNGSGTFVINTAGQPVVSGTVISSTAFNALTADLATGLSTAITKDGQTTPTANIPMGNNKITGLAVGTAATDAANLSQVQSTVSKLINSVSGADTITGTMSPTLTAYATGQMFYFIAAGDNTGAVTLNIDSLGAKAVTRDGSVALVAGDIKSGEVVVVVYDGTRFQVVSQLNSAGDARFANVSITSALNVGGVATFSAGTAAAPSITTSGDTNTGIFFPAADTIAFAEGGVEAARFDSAGNFGLGVTPSAWGSVFKALQISGGSFAAGAYSDVGTHVSGNAFYDGANWKYIATDEASNYYQQNGAHVWRTAASGTAGNTITFYEAMSVGPSVITLSADEGNIAAASSIRFRCDGTERMRLDLDGNLLVGTTSTGNLRLQEKVAITHAGSNTYTGLAITGYTGAFATARPIFDFNRSRGTTDGSMTVVANGDELGSVIFRGSDGSAFRDAAAITGSCDGTPGSNDMPGRLVFLTTPDGSNDPVERARITSGGDFLLNTTTKGYGLFSSSRFTLGNGGAGDGFCVGGINQDLSAYTVQGNNNTGTRYAMYIANGSSTAVGTISFTSAATAYNTSSDRRLKDNIALADDAGAVIDAIEVVKHDWKVGGHVRYGVVAQDLHDVAPEAVTVGDSEDVETLKNPWSVDYSKLVPMLIKEVQSLRKRVAELEAK